MPPPKHSESGKWLAIGILAMTVWLPTERAQTQVITSSFAGAYSFEGQVNTLALAYNGAPIDNLQVGDLLKVGVASSATLDRFMASQWGSDFDAGKYFEFTLTAEAMPGIPFANFDLTSVEFALRRSSSGPRQFEWRSSTDNFAAPITTFGSLNAGIFEAGGRLTLPNLNATQTYDGNTLLLSGPAYENQTSLTFRLYAYASGSELGQGGLDSPLAFEGAMSIPEPSTWALLLAGSAAFLLWGYRRRA